jgi:hypothetical protein
MEAAVIKAGNIIRIPKGAAYIGSYGKVKQQRQDYVVAVVDGRREAPDGSGEGLLDYTVGAGDDWRTVNEGSVTLLDSDVHRLTVGKRQIRGGGWGGWAASYTTKGKCSCGRQCWQNGSTAREVRRHWREHIIALADTAYRERELAAVARDLAENR